MITETQTAIIVLQLTDELLAQLQPFLTGLNITTTATQRLTMRVEVYEAAKARHPERWSGATRNWQPILVVHLNPEKHAAEAVNQKENDPAFKTAA